MIQINKTLTKYKKTELSIICKQYKLKCSGKKAELVSRIEDYLKNNKVNTETKNDTKQPEQKFSNPILQAQNKIIIKKNMYGNYEHKKTHLVFDTIQRVVVGYQEQDGSVVSLTPNHLKTCLEYDFNYKLPDNIETQKTIKPKCNPIPIVKRLSQESIKTKIQTDIKRFLK